MDNRQFRAIVDAYADMVYRIALNQTRRGADADDVVQAVFLKLYEKPPVWLGRASAAEQADGGRSLRSSRSAAPNAATDERLRAWLIRVTVNECRNLWRTLWHRRVELREVSDADTPPYEEPAFSESAHERLYAALGELPEKCRIVVHLFYFEDMGTREIAAVLGIKEPTVRTRLVRARKLLKQTLKEAWDDEQCQPVQSHDGRGPCLC
ncbi:RNA polymerase sigma factor [Adlercreutzia caecimuris]|uniref:Sigma-70 family RNA polymerase sigma factor n=1 Tax=Adlercreutzia caecimuris B7 TaxID=1235794 RepID=R9KU50_9ACTN|nr:RNA polymerase sigma factor [Adlercreutzia caecimuris]EOS49793.1 sigma-70 family RNA polymerase sigma factor [Adlercreutzia caecimuris B7]